MPPAGVDEAQARRRLKGASVNGIAVNVASQFVRYVLRFAYQVVIARLLLPGDFGIVAMAAPAISFIQLFADLGLAQATIQYKSISQAQLSFLFYVNLAAGTALGGLCALSAPLVARFYGDPRVAGIMVASGALLFVSGLYAQHAALLNRQMRFTLLAAMDVVGFAVGAAAGIAAALHGLGYWAIMINQAGVTVTALLIAWGLSGWRPGRPGKFSDMMPLLRFGGNMTGFNFVNFFSRNSDNILLGRFAGAAPLGLYDRAFKLMLLPFGQISLPFTNVALPLLSRCVDEPEFYRRAYRRMLEAMLLLLYPGIAFMVVNAQELVDVALGRRWAAVAPIFALLGIDAFVSPLGISMGWLFVSQGRTREMRDWAVLTSFLFVGCFVAGLHWGPRGVAGGYAVAGLAEMSFLWHIATRRGPLRARDFFALLIPFLIALGATFAVDFVAGALLPAGLFSLGVEGAASYGVFALALVAQPKGRHVLVECAGDVRRRLKL